MNLQLKPYRSTHHSQQHLSSSPSYRKYNTIFYKRTKRTEHLLSYKEQRTGRVMYSERGPTEPRFCEHTEQLSHQSETGHFEHVPLLALHVK